MQSKFRPKSIKFIPFGYYNKLMTNQVTLYGHGHRTSNQFKFAHNPRIEDPNQ